MSWADDFGLHEAEFPQAGHRLGLRWFHLTTASVKRPGSTPVIDALRTSRKTYLDEARALATVVLDESRALTGYELGRWAFLNGQIDSLDQQIRKAGYTTGLVLKGAQAQWLPGDNVATCIRYHAAFETPEMKNHRVPKLECGCGFWAYWRLGEVQTRHPAVCGLVKAWGRVIQNPKRLGFRAEKAKIIGIWLPEWDTSVANELEERYQADVYEKFAEVMVHANVPKGQPALGLNWTGAPQFSRADYTHECKACGERKCPPFDGRCLRCKAEGRHAVRDDASFQPGSIPRRLRSRGGDGTPAFIAMGGSPAAVGQRPVVGNNQLAGMKAAIDWAVKYIQETYGPKAT